MLSLTNDGYEAEQGTASQPELEAVRYAIVRLIGIAFDSKREPKISIVCNDVLSQWLGQLAIQQAQHSQQHLKFLDGRYLRKGVCEEFCRNRYRSIGLELKARELR